MRAVPVSGYSYLRIFLSSFYSTVGQGARQDFIALGVCLAILHPFGKACNWVRWRPGKRSFALSSVGMSLWTTSSEVACTRRGLEATKCNAFPLPLSIFRLRRRSVFSFTTEMTTFFLARTASVEEDHCLCNSPCFAIGTVMLRFDSMSTGKEEEILGWKRLATVLLKNLVT